MDITRRIVFHAGHMLKDDTSKCYHPHGHEYVLEVTIQGDIQTGGAENGMVMNFGSLKSLMMDVIHDKFDHKFIIEKDEPRFEDFMKAVGSDGVVVMTSPPTAENLIIVICNLLQSFLRPGVKITKIRLQETYQCWVELCQ